jgi:hypothetical protein
MPLALIACCPAAAASIRSATLILRCWGITRTADLAAQPHLSYERDLSKRDRLRVSITHDRLSFLVPNELLQLAGQRQTRQNDETPGTIHYQRTISTDLVLNVQGSVRDTSSRLASNPLSTPILVSEQRGFREGYVRADLAGTNIDSWLPNRHGARALAWRIFFLLWVLPCMPPTIAPSRHPLRKSSTCQFPASGLAESGSATASGPAISW